ncbi:hypothetical protein [Mycobacterium sp. OTB74]|uniref:hypothetical protein n=1 Tax=Mycobacterium sp. OTB74 TaxID=1853452 RepID=UPI002475345A|nr:hypothetical protein [Mycobacterium sp. OTB74]MDH6245028.1 hypothetical protein [Mycobacterium sp. OTB74]
MSTHRRTDRMGRPSMSLSALTGRADTPPPPPPPDRQDWNLTPIPTVYAGIEFRSRLEARWACFFDQLGWRWTYEPFDGTGYIPDFLLHHDPPHLAEVKPAVTEADYRAAIGKITTGLAGHWTGPVLILGVDPFPAWDQHTTPMGLLGTGGNFTVHYWTDNTDAARAAWAHACNTTKWRRP